MDQELGWEGAEAKRDIEEQGFEFEQEGEKLVRKNYIVAGGSRFDKEAVGRSRKGQE